MAGDNDQNEKDKEHPADTIPEVDAEIVVDDAAASPEPFDDISDDPGDGPDDGPDDQPAPTETVTPPKRSFIGAGVLFFAGMVVVAIAAGAFWYFTTNTATEAVIDKTTASTPAAISDAGAPDETPAAKISNNDLSVAKPVSAPAPQPTESLADSVAEVSTPAETIANTETQDAAKNVATNASPLPDIEQAVDETAPPIYSLEPEGPAPDEPYVDELQSPLESEDTTLEADGIVTPYTDVIEPGVALDAVDAPVIAERPPPGNAFDAKGADYDVSTETIATLETALADERLRATALSEALDDTRRDMASINEALSEARAAVSAARVEISDLRAENDTLKTTPRPSPVAAGAVALNAIFKAAESGAPYAPQLATLKQAVPESLAIAVLARYAQTGAPALSKIRNDFDAAARAGLATANRENADGVVERYGARVAGLFNVRPATPQPGAAPGAVISRADHAVDEGNLSLAVEELQSLPTPAQEAMSAWIDLARQRAEFDAALHSVNAELAEQARRPGSL